MSKDYESLYHVFRWCKWYQGGKCINEAFAGSSADVDGVYKVAEDGRLSGVLEETLGSVKFSAVESAIIAKLEEFNLSRKRINDVIGDFALAMESFLGKDCRDALDEAVSKLYQDDAVSREKSGEGVEIADPHTFYCKEFW